MSMVKVLMVAGAPLKRAVLSKGAERIKDMHGRVVLLGTFEEGSPSFDPAFGSTRHISEIRHFRATVRSMGASFWTWWSISRDSTARQLASDADVLVALDPVAIYAVWELAQRNPTAEAIYGIGPALRVIEERSSGHRQLTRVPPLRYVLGSIALPLRTARQWIAIMIKAGLLAATGPNVLRNRTGEWILRKLSVMPGLSRTRLKGRIDAVRSGQEAYPAADD